MIAFVSSPNSLGVGGNLARHGFSFHRQAMSQSVARRLAGPGWLRVPALEHHVVLTALLVPVHDP